MNIVCALGKDSRSCDFDIDEEETYLFIELAGF